MIIDYGGSLTVCLSTDDPGGGFPLGMPDRADGWFLQHIDTGDTFFHSSGIWNPMGLGFSYAPPTKSGRVTVDAQGRSTVTFTTPFLDDQYSVQLTCHQLSVGTPALAQVTERAAHSFSITVVNSRSGSKLGGVLVNWKCTLDYNA